MLLRGVFVFVAGCTFHHGNTAVIDAPTEALDGSVDVMTDSTTASSCFGAGTYQVCLTQLPTTPITLGTMSIVTDTCATGEIVVVANGGPNLCVLSGTSVSVNGSIRGQGTLPLAIVATTGDLTLSGNIDVSSRRGMAAGAGANDSHCTDSTAAVNSNGGGGGGGGTFGTKGGTGGTGPGAGGIPPNPTATPTFVRGGCKGSKGADGGDTGGAGGDGGGAVYLVATGTLMIQAGINASGAGGTGAAASSNGSKTGGGGGGSGGMIALFGGAGLAFNGLLFANGGGGGGGGDDAPGGPGGESSSPTTVAAAGTRGLAAGGLGGVGAVNTQVGGVGANGMGGGGGGGAVGIVKVVSGQTISGSTVSPPPSP
jgi:hypothetical protein